MTLDVDPQALRDAGTAADAAATAAQGKDGNEAADLVCRAIPGAFVLPSSSGDEHEAPAAWGSRVHRWVSGTQAYAEGLDSAAAAFETADAEAALAAQNLLRRLAGVPEVR